MENEFVPYEEALALKELGYIGDCLSFYNPTMDGIRMDYFTKKGYTGMWSYFGKPKSTLKLSPDSESMTVEWYQKELDEVALTPLYQQAFRWFRDKKYVAMVSEVDGKFDFRIEHNSNEFYFESDEYCSYEEAELVCLRKLIEIEKTK